MAHIYKHIQAHITGSYRPGLLPTRREGLVAVIGMTWGDGTGITWGDGTVVDWSNP